MPGWTCELEAAVNEDIGLAHRLMSDGSLRVIVLQWDFLNDWHKLDREHWRGAGDGKVSSAVAQRNVAFTQLGV